MYFFSSTTTILSEHGPRAVQCRLTNHPHTNCKTACKHMQLQFPVGWYNVKCVPMLCWWSNTVTPLYATKQCRWTCVDGTWIKKGGDFKKTPEDNWFDQWITCNNLVLSVLITFFKYRWDSLIHKLTALRASWALGVVAQKRFRQSGCHFAVLWGLLAGFDTVETPVRGKILVQFLYFHLQWVFGPRSHIWIH